MSLKPKEIKPIETKQMDSGYKMDAVFMNSENSKTFEYHVLALKLTDKLDLKRGHCFI